MYPSKQTFFILGLSKSGFSVAKFLLEQGAKVYLFDDVFSEKIEENVRFLQSLGGIRLSKEEITKMPETADALVLSPGIPIDHPMAIAFRKAKKAVLGEMEIAVRYLPCLMVAITGTNGKTTTVSMLEKILVDAGKNAFACGNIGSPMVDFTSSDKNAIAVAEVSSFQLETLNSHTPHISAILNVTEDHLNRHYNMENYVFLKSKILKNATETEYAVLNFDDETVRSFAGNTKAKVVYFSARQKVNGAYYENGNLYYFGEKILSAAELFAEGIHNVQNALAAIAIAKLLGVESPSIAKSLAEFKGIKHRIETVGVIDGVRYIDDSKATNVDATIKAVGCMKNSTVLLLGGKDKGYDYDGLFSILSKSKVVHAVLYGENKFRLLESASRVNYGKITLCPNFNIAVRVSQMIAEKGQTVLLSPASASFDEFSGYEERGDAFVEIVRSFEKSTEEELETDEEIEQLKIELPVQVENVDGGGSFVE